MKPKERLEYLKEEHARLDKHIDDLDKHTVPDQEKMHDLKKKRLQIKDEIAKIEANDAIEWKTVTDDPTVE